MPFQIVRNDITRMRVDAIVNAANRSLLGGGGVDGAIHHAAGPELLKECMTLGGCETGQAKITGGYLLPAKYVIHTVGPIWHGGDRGEEQLLRSCYRNALALAAEKGCESVAFPMISAGVYGYPKDQAMMIAVEEIGRFLLDHEMTVYLVVFGRESFLAGTKLFRDVREYIDDRYAERHEHREIESRRKRLWHQNEKAALEYDQFLASEPVSTVTGPEEEPERLAPNAFIPDTFAAPSPAIGSMSRPDWAEILERTDESFSEALLRLIDERGMTDAQCYKKANVDRKLFSKIRSNPGYRPSKPTAVAFAVALELNLEETEQLIRKAGYALTGSSKFDLVVEYFIRNDHYVVSDINLVLFEFDLPLLGSQVA